MYVGAYSVGLGMILARDQVGTAWELGRVRNAGCMWPMGSWVDGGWEELGDDGWVSNMEDCVGGGAGQGFSDKN